MRPNRRAYSAPELVPTRKYIQHPTQPNLFFPVHRRPIRLPDVDYASRECCCFVTYNLLPGSERLVGQIGDTAWDALAEKAYRIGFTLHAACMMPDHAHILLNPSGKGETVGRIVGDLKKSQFFAVRNAHDVYLRFQDMSWDHVLGRSGNAEQEFEAVVWYIRQNPVRAGLVKRPDEYPYLL